MKGQLIPFVFLVLLVASVMIGYVYYNTFYGSEYQLNVFNVRVIDAIRNIIEDFKSYSKLSLTYSSHQALREHACNGGLIGAGPWICNGPNPVEPDQSKQCLEKYTKYYFNVYTSFFNSTLPVEISKANFTNLAYDINTGEISSGKYDEGNFWVNSSGAKITITSGNANEFENVAMNDYVIKNRYWYLFRNFYDWAMNDVYSPCICQNAACSCGSGSSEQVCDSGCNSAAYSCAQTALNDLQGRFDQYVKCDMSQACCAQGTVSGSNDCGCKGWENSICQTGCEHNCNEPSQESICPVGSIESLYSQSSLSASNPYSKTGGYKISFSSADKISFQGGGGECCIEARFSAAYNFWCVDTKYNVPSDKGPVPLIFRVGAIGDFRDPCGCGCYEC